MNKDIFLTTNIHHTLFTAKDYELKKIKLEIENRGFNAKFVSSNEMSLNYDVPFAAINMSGIVTESHFKYLRNLELKGTKVLNEIYYSKIADEKMLCYIELSNKGIKMPRTIDLDICYLSMIPTLGKKLKEILNFPIVIKHTDSGMGYGVLKVNNLNELIDILGMIFLSTTKNGLGIKNTSIIAQEFIPEGAEESIRVIVVNNKCLGAMKRITKNENWKTNLSNDNEAIFYPLDENLKNLSLKICKLLNLKLAGLDFYITKNNEYILGEVNSTPQYGGNGFDVVIPDANVSKRIVEALIY